jgi:chitodextrinase
MKINKIFAKFGAILIIIFSMLCQSVAASDTQVPTVPKGLTVTGKTYTSISLSWTASSDNLKVKGYQIFRDGKKISTSSKAVYTNSNLVPGVQYSFSVRAYDTAGNVSESSTVINAATLSDPQSPSAPEDLKSSAVTFTSVSLNWKPSTDNVGIKGYELYCNDKKVASTTAVFYEYKKLTPGIAYTIYIKAYDKAGNYSSKSNSVSVNTASDITAPAPPTGLKASSIAVSDVNLSWSPASDNVGVKGYDIIRDGVKVGTSSKTSYCSKGLFPGKSYTYTVRASDISGNLSNSSSPLKVNTSKDSQTPAPPSNLKVTAANGASVSLSWTASTDNGKIAGYQIYCNGIVITTSISTSRIVKNPFGPGLYEFWVKAYDQSGNLSGSSNTVAATTP